MHRGSLQPSRTLSPLLPSVPARRSCYFPISGFQHSYKFDTILVVLYSDWIENQALCLGHRPLFVRRRPTSVFAERQP